MHLYSQSLRRASTLEPGVRGCWAPGAVRARFSSSLAAVSQQRCVEWRMGACVRQRAVISLAGHFETHGGSNNVMRLRELVGLAICLPSIRGGSAADCLDQPALSLDLRKKSKLHITSVMFFFFHHGLRRFYHRILVSRPTMPASHVRRVGADHFQL